MFEQKIAQLNNERSRKKSYSVPEVQKLLKVERHTVYKLIKEGHFKGRLYRRQMENFKVEF